MMNEQSEETLRRVFLADYERIESMMSRVLETAARQASDEVLAVWLELEAAIVARLDAEERVILPLLLGRLERDSRALVHENKHIRRRLAEARRACESANLSKVGAVLEELRAHALHEHAVIEKLRSGR